MFSTLLKPYRGRIFLATSSGMLLTLCFPKIDLGICAWIALVPLFLSLRQCTPREAFATGFWTGLAHYAGLLYWTVHTMTVYGYLPVYQSVTLMLLLAAYMAAYHGLFSAALVWFCAAPRYLIVVAPAVWVALELIRARLFTGFPWELLGHSQHDALWMLQSADILGAYGLSALIVVVNAALAAAVLHWLEKPWQSALTTRVVMVRGLTAAAILVAAALGYGIVRLGQMESRMADAPRAKVAVVQGNIDQASKWDPSFQMLTAVKYKTFSLEPAISACDLIIWPETATPFYFLHDKLLSDMVIDGIRSADAHFIIGSPSFSQIPGSDQVVFYNSAYLMNPSGEAAGRYDKVHLVPFGEYVPLQKWLPFIKKLVAHVGDFKTGQQGSTLAWGQYRIGMLICYEVIFADLGRAMTQNGAQLLVNITNDAWFGRTSAAYQHFSMAVFRSVENRRSLARAANTGVSGFIDPCGRVLSATELYVETAATAEAPLLNETTLYTRLGDRPIAVMAFGLLAVFTAKRFRRRLVLGRPNGTGRA